jgi:hypothetical protein
MALKQKRQKEKVTSTPKLQDKTRQDKKDHVL